MKEAANPQEPRVTSATPSNIHNPGGSLRAACVYGGISAFYFIPSRSQRECELDEKGRAWCTRINSSVNFDAGARQGVAIIVAFKNRFRIIINNKLFTLFITHTHTLTHTDFKTFQRRPAQMAFNARILLIPFARRSLSRNYFSANLTFQMSRFSARFFFSFSLVIFIFLFLLSRST